MRLIFIAFVLMLLPGFMLVCIDNKPSVRYWVGNTGYYVVGGISAWVILVYMALVKKTIRRGTAVIAALILPSLLVASVCQFQVWQLTAVSSALSSSDCESFINKASLERSWQAAYQFGNACIEDLVEVTGANAKETAKITDINRCKGYAKVSQDFGKDWWYLSYVESKYKCAGWCTPNRTLWEFDPSIRDSCSVAVAHLLGNSVKTFGVQVISYSAIMVGIVGLSVILFPKWLEV